MAGFGVIRPLFYAYALFVFFVSLILLLMALRGERKSSSPGRATVVLLVITSAVALLSIADSIRLTRWGTYRQEFVVFKERFEVAGQLGGPTRMPEEFRQAAQRMTATRSVPSLTTRLYPFGSFETEIRNAREGSQMSKDVRDALLRKCGEAVPSQPPQGT